MILFVCKCMIAHNFISTVIWRGCFSNRFLVGTTIFTYTNYCVFIFLWCLYLLRFFQYYMMKYISILKATATLQVESYTTKDVFHSWFSVIAFTSANSFFFSI